MTHSRRTAALALALAAAVPFTAALAAPDAARMERRAAGPTRPATVPFDAPAAISAVYHAGYAAVSELEWGDGGWQVKAIDANGRRVRLYVDPVSGAVTVRERAERRAAGADAAAFDAPSAIAEIYGAGYVAVTELERERGGWKAKAADADKRAVELRVDGATGAVTVRSRSDRLATMPDVAFDAPAAISAVYGAGYAAIRELGRGDGAWKVKAIDGDGRRVELRVDPATGGVTVTDRAARRAVGTDAEAAAFDAPSAISAVYGAGYTAVTELERERGGWKAKALDANGRRVTLRVDATTGTVTSRGR